jgi:hypothetical protein
MVPKKAPYPGTDPGVGCLAVSLSCAVPACPPQTNSASQVQATSNPAAESNHSSGQALVYPNAHNCPVSETPVLIKEFYPWLVPCGLLPQAPFRPPTQVQPLIPRDGDTPHVLSGLWGNRQPLGPRGNAQTPIVNTQFLKSPVQCEHIVKAPEECGLQVSVCDVAGMAALRSLFLETCSLTRPATSSNSCEHNGVIYSF